MKIQQINRIVTFGKLQHERDARSAILAVIENSSGKRVALRKPTYDYSRREIFHPSEFNLTEIGVIEDVESYVRQAFQKKTALMFKEGEKFTGKSSETIKYVKTRITQAEHASGVLWRILLRETGYALMSRSNYFWVKVRNKDASGGRALAGLTPIAGYFGMGAENVQIKKDKSGKIIKYRQQMPDGRYRDFNPRDIIHFYAYKKDGFSFGTPQLVSVKEDIRALRRIEENIELLIYQTLFPIFQYQVGTETKPAGDVRLADGTIVSEVDYVRGQIREMPSDGGIVIPERHEIKFIGAEGKALKAREYLDYFKTRVLSGLGMSSVDMGEGSTANRATADNMSKTMVDSVKDYQDIIEEFINKHVIKELLLESTFNFDILDALYNVTFKFKEIDIEEQLKKNTNAQLLYGGNVLDIDETRAIAGEEPITDDQEPKMYLERVKLKEVEAQIQGNLQVAEIGAAAKAAASSSSSAANSAKNSNAPTNQHGTKTGPQKTRLDYLKIKDGYVGTNVRALKKDIVNHIKRQIIKKDWINVLVEMNKEDMIDKYIGIDRRAFVKGYQDAGGTLDNANTQVSKGALGPINTRTKRYIKKLLKDLQGKVIQTLDRGIKKGEKRSIIAKSVEEVVDTIEYRGDFIDATERAKAYNYGKAISLKDQDFTMAVFDLNPDCETCRQFPQIIDLFDFTVEDIPPFHPNSSGVISHGI